MISRNKLVKLVLDKNKSANHIDKPLNLIREIPDTDISVTWDISDGRVLNYDGQIMSASIDERHRLLIKEMIDLPQILQIWN